MHRVPGVTILLLILLAAPVWGSGIYRWTDADGRVHFGDAPPDRSKADGVELQYNDMGAAPVASDAFDTRQPVVMYSAAWCGVCSKAKAFLQSRAVPFREYDIETSRKGREDYRRLQGTGVPIILVGAERMNGFNAAKLTGWLELAGHLHSAP